MTQRILIIGGSGYVGQYICRDLPEILGNDYEFYATYCNTNVFSAHPEIFKKVKETFRLELDKDSKDVIALIQMLKPTFIINPAAMSAVPQCQTNPEAAYKVNDPSEWAKIAYENGCKRFIHESTDMVYKGQNGPYSEDGLAEPVSTMVYGLSKKKGEDNLLAVAPATILRSALVIGKANITGMSRGSTLDWMTKAIRESTPEKPASFYSNELRSPILVDDIVRIVSVLIKKTDEIPSPLILNMGGSTDCSRYEMGQGIAKRIGVSLDNVKPSLQEPLQGGIERPRDIRMTNGKLKSTLGIEICTLDQALDYIYDVKPHPYV